MGNWSPWPSSLPMLPLFSSTVISVATVAADHYRDQQILTRPQTSQSDPSKPPPSTSKPTIGFWNEPKGHSLKEGNQPKFPNQKTRETNDSRLSRDSEFQMTNELALTEMERVIRKECLWETRNIQMRKTKTERAYYSVTLSSLLYSFFDGALFPGLTEAINEITRSNNLWEKGSWDLGSYIIERCQKKNQARDWNGLCSFL